MLTVFLLSACSNLSPRVFFSEGGTRHASGGVAPPVDTAVDSGLEDSGDSGGEASTNAPVITDIESSVDEDTSEAVVLIHYTDAQDDLIGGAVTFRITVGQDSPVEHARSVVDAADDPIPGTQAGDHGEYLEVRFGTLGSGTHLVDFIELEDAAGNRSSLGAHEVSVP